jgi:hypothetical protein
MMNLETGSRPARRAQALARALGWFSIGLGAAEFFAPRMTAKAVGLRGSEGVVKAYGAREIATGVAILATKNPTPWIWGRVLGDVLDLATLGVQARRGQAMKAGLAIAAVAGVAALDVACAKALGKKPRQAVRDYSDRRGMPRPADEMRGAARADFEAPRDMRTPSALRPYPTLNDEVQAATRH